MKLWSFCKTVSPRGQSHVAIAQISTLSLPPEPSGSPDGSLLRRRGLFHGHRFDVGDFVLLIGLIQESVDDVSALLFLDPSFLRFRLFGEELVVDFPTHSILHP
jgi:hypothetical protein